MIKNYPILKKLLPLFFILLFSFSAFSQIIYSEDFENGSGLWGTPPGGGTYWAYYNAANSNNYIFTSLESSGDYKDRANVIAYSPTLSLAGYSSFTFQFDIWYKTEVNYDGMKVEYSLNNGLWTDLGSMNSINWYNNSNVVAFNTTEDGWSGNSGGWVTHSINSSAENILFNNSSQVRFRIIFASDEKVTNVGVAFDNILIVGNSGLDFVAAKKNYVDFGDNHDFTGSFSLEAWVLQKTSTDARTIISKGDVKTGNLRGYHLFLNNGIPTLTWYNNAGVSILNIVSPYAITNGKWYHIAATYDGTTAKIYVDGILVISAPIATPPINGTENFHIGAMYDSSAKTNPQNYFNGYIDEVRVWDVALSALQIREMMNQEIKNDGSGNVKGAIVPLNVAGLTWTNLKGYYPMNDNTANDKSGNLVKKNGSTRNMVTIQPQTAPLPYVSKYISTSGGNWTDSVAWVNGDVQNPPNSTGYNNTPIDWNIVETSHNINSGAKDITVLGLISTAGKLTIDGNNALGTGQSLRVTHYLELDGDIDLVGESQLLQDTGSILDQDSGGYIERDQQGTANSYNYNYWSSSVGPISAAITKSTRGTGVASTNAGNYLGINGRTEGLMDGTSSGSPISINFLPSYKAADLGPSTPSRTISTYWLYTFYGADDNYWAWKSVQATTPILAGEGYTMKGTSGAVAIATMQNYVFKGKPYNGDFTLHIDQGKDRLIGNPYPSAMDANKFIDDNIKTGGSNLIGNVFNGALYFWDHFGYINSHNLGAYVGGYATYTKMGGSKAYSNDVRINNNGSRGNKRPGQYIPVGQGFFVIAVNDSLTNSLITPIIINGGDIVFKNSQRTFIPESLSNSVFMKGIKAKPNQPADGKENTDSKIDTRPKIWLQFDSPAGYHRQMLIGADENTTNHFDLGFDAFIADIGSEDMFWTFDGAKFVIQGVPEFDDNQEFSIGIKIAKAGLARINIDELENMDEDISLHIKDKLTGESHNISKKPFEIDLAPGTYLDRFALTFKMQKLVAEDVVAELLVPATSQPIIEGIHVFMNNATGELQIKNNSTEEIVSVTLINAVGQTIKTWNSNFNIRTISLPVSTATGVYLVQINMKTGKTVKKISVE